MPEKTPQEQLDKLAQTYLAEFDSLSDKELHPALMPILQSLRDVLKDMGPAHLKVQQHTDVLTPRERQVHREKADILHRELLQQLDTLKKNTPDAVSDKDKTTFSDKALTALKNSTDKVVLLSTLFYLTKAIMANKPIGYEGIFWSSLGVLDSLSELAHYRKLYTHKELWMAATSATLIVAGNALLISSTLNPMLALSGVGIAISFIGTKLASRATQKLRDRLSNPKMVQESPQSKPAPVAANEQEQQFIRLVQSFSEQLTILPKEELPENTEIAIDELKSILKKSKKYTQEALSTPRNLALLTPSQMDQIEKEQQSLINRLELLRSLYRQQHNLPEKTQKMLKRQLKKNIRIAKKAKKYRLLQKKVINNKGLRAGEVYQQSTDSILSLNKIYHAWNELTNKERFQIVLGTTAMLSGNALMIASFINPAIALTGASIACVILGSKLSQRAFNSQEERLLKKVEERPKVAPTIEDKQKAQATLLAQELIAQQKPQMVFHGFGTTVAQTMPIKTQPPKRKRPFRPDPRDGG